MNRKLSLSSLKKESFPQAAESFPVKHAHVSRILPSFLA